jgi:hypothetical protein
MLINGEEITAVLNKVRVAREHLNNSWPPKDAYVFSVMDFHWAVQDIYALQIEMLKVSFAAEHVRGKVERYGNSRARVLIRAAQSPEFLRFVTVKELCHLMIDESDDWSSLGVETVKGLLKEWALTEENGTGHTNPSDPLKSEMLAEIAAIEMMYPRAFRSGDITKIKANEATLQKVALQHELPAYAIEQAHRHHDILESCWVAIDQAI